MLLLLIPVFLLSCKKKDPNEIVKAKAHMLLVMDAAHGGSDVGSATAAGHTEKDLVLKLCNKMAALSGQYNIEVVLTRKEDVSLSADERLAIANPLNADAFISLHINQSNPAKAVDGYEIIVAPDNPKYAESRQLAAQILTHLVFNGTLVRHVERGVNVVSNNLHPALAIECGDINNTKDLEALANEDKLEALCRTMLKAIVAYRNSR